MDNETESRDPVWVKLHEQTSSIQKLKERVARHDAKLSALERYTEMVSQQMTEMRNDNKASSGKIESSIRNLEGKVDTVQLEQGKTTTILRTAQWVIGILLMIAASPSLVKWVSQLLTYIPNSGMA